MDNDKDENKLSPAHPTEPALSERARWDETRELLKRALSAWESTEPKGPQQTAGSPSAPPSSALKASEGGEPGEREEFRSLFEELQKKIKELS